jgi:glutathione S-transferase
VLKIYGVPISVHTRKAIVLAIAKNLAYELVAVVPVIPGNPPSNWRELSPTGRIPALADGEFTLADSAAICAYLERLKPEPSFYPREARACASALALEQYAGTLFADVVHPLFHETFVQPKIRNVPTDRARVERVLKEAVPEHFGYLDRLAWSEQLTVGDVAVASNLVTFQYMGFELSRARYPRLAGQFARMTAEPAFQEALRRERPVVAQMGLQDGFLAEHVQDR